MTEAHADVWQHIIEDHHNHRKKMIELNLDITEAMTNYLSTVGETKDFTIRFEDDGRITLTCQGDLFDLEQIGDFCDVFNLKLIINNRVVVENHLDDSTEVRTKYLFFTQRLHEKMEDKA